MTYNPATDFLGLWRAVAGGVQKGEIPGLDLVVAALGRANLINVSVSNIAPLANQATTAWFSPAVPSYSGEGTLYLWNAVAVAYQAATPRLLVEMLAAAEKVAGVSTAISSLLDTLGAARGDIAFRGASGWQALAPGAAGYLFSSNGAGADPTWNAPAVGVASINGLTGTPSVVAGTGIASIAAAVASVTVNASAAQIPGTVTNDNAAAGNLGEYVTINVASGAAVALAASPHNVTSLTLTAGDWEVSAVMVLNGITGTGLANVQASISTVSATLGAVGLTSSDAYNSQAFAMFSDLPNNVVTLRPGPHRVSLAAPATVYLVGQLLTVTGTADANGYGQLRARRVR